MNQKMRYKIALDFLMTVLFIVLMAYQVVGDAAHEWVGSGMFVAIVLHQLLNRGWYKTIVRGRYTLYRVLQTGLNLLVLLDIIGLMLSGIFLSETVFAFLHLQGGLSVARLVHLAGSYWGLVFMSLHLGLHWGMVVGLLQKHSTVFKSKVLRPVFKLLALGIAIYGAAAFFGNRIPTYLFLQTQFVFFDYSKPAVLVFTEYLAMMGTFVWLSYYGAKLLRKQRTTQ